MKTYQGGRHLEDIEQFWYAVANRIKEYFPINGVPPEIAKELRLLTDAAETLVKQGERFLARQEISDGLIDE